MIGDDLQTAKEIFFKYACNRFYLDREVDALEYKRLDVSNGQEKKWRHEYILHWISQLSVDNLHAVDCLRDTYAEEALPEMFRLSELGDSYAKLWYANAIWDIAWGGFMSPIMRERARRKSISLWESLLENPIVLTDNHRKKLPASFPVGEQEKYILYYANSKLAESKKRGFFQFLFVSFVLSIVWIANLFLDLADKFKRFGKHRLQNI